MDLEDKQSCFETFHILHHHSQTSQRGGILTYDEGWLDLKVEGDTELAHLVPGRAAVLTSVTGLGSLYEQHVSQGVQPRPVVDRLEEVAVDVEPAEGWRGHRLDPARQGGHVALLHADVELLVAHLLRLGIRHRV